MTFNRYSYPDLDDAICIQLRERLGEIPAYSTATPRVSTTLAADPFLDQQVWISNLGGDETEWGQQDLSYQVRVIVKNVSGRDSSRTCSQLARTVRSIFDSEELMWYKLDNETPSSPIYESVSEWSTTTPAPVSLYEQAGVTTWYFTLRIHQVSLIEPQPTSTP